MFTDMFIDDGVVEIICMVIINMEKSLESCHHELFLSTLNEMLRVSHIQVKEICSSVENFKTSLLSLHNSYPKDDSNYQARYFISRHYFIQNFTHNRYANTKICIDTKF